MWAVEALKEWHDFYVLVGTAGATLLALLFVAVSCRSRFLDRRTAVGGEHFYEPGRCPFHERVLLVCCRFIPMASGQILRSTDWRHRFDRCSTFDLHHGPGRRMYRYDVNYVEDYLEYGLQTGLGLSCAARGSCVNLSGKGLWTACAGGSSFAVGSGQHP